MPKSIKIAKIGSNFVIHQINPNKLSKPLKKLPKLQNFAISGHTEQQPVL